MDFLHSKTICTVYLHREVLFYTVSNTFEYRLMDITFRKPFTSYCDFCNSGNFANVCLLANVIISLLISEIHIHRHFVLYVGSAYLGISLFLVNTLLIKN